MKRLRIWRRWFTRRIGYARLVCLVLLIGFAQEHGLRGVGQVRASKRYASKAGSFTRFNFSSPAGARTTSPVMGL